MRPSTLLLAFLLASSLFAQPAEDPNGKSLRAYQALQSFRWVNERPERTHPDIQHGTFFSESNQNEVGYAYYLPEGYHAHINSLKRYPTIYWLHGGRPGNEYKQPEQIHNVKYAIAQGWLPPVIYVFVNGGKLSHYNYLGYKGRDAFLELIQHMDTNFRTISDARGRAIEGTSQGARGVARYIFEYPELFSSAIAISGGFAHEKNISLNNGVESKYIVMKHPHFNVWDNAQRFADKDTAQSFKYLVVVGTEEGNFQSNQEYHQHLNTLGIEHDYLPVKGAGHGYRRIYPIKGEQIFRWQGDNLRASVSDWESEQ